MRAFFLKTTLVCSLVLPCIFANAGGLSYVLSDYQNVKAHGKSTTLVDIDNDTLLLRKDDGFYTSGMRLTQQYTLQDAAQSTTYGWRIGQEIYTASDIKLPPALINPNDHPYAGWLYGGFFKSTHRGDGTHAKYGVDLGCIGPCAGGEWVQTNLHRIISQPLPQGWSTQIKNELGAVLYADVAPVRWTMAPWLDATPNIHGRFGNIYTDAGAGITLRAGRLNIFPQQSTLHGFIRVDASAVGYNASLQGGYFSSGSPRTVKPKRFVGEAEAGLAWLDGPFGIRASIVRRGNEIDGLPNSIGAQNFARLQFSYAP